jgi:SpoVK/Ycf46/Vps4 family AAA+-type ATPase
MQDLHDLKLLLDSHVGLIVVESVEEPRVIEMFGRLMGSDARGLYLWSRTDGLRLVGHSAPKIIDPEPEAALRTIKGAAQPGVYLLLDFHPYLEDALHVRLLKDIAHKHDKVGHTLVLISHAVEVPPEIKTLTARFELMLPSQAGLEQIVREEARLWTTHHGQKVRTERNTLQMLVRNLAGLTAADARRLARQAIADDGAITAMDLPNVLAAKHRLLDQGGAVSFEFDTARFGDVGGLRNLKRWLEMRRAAFFEPEEGVDPPKGILLVGVQGGGKSLAAKACAGAWGLPLLRLDFGALYNKFFGETEKNLREALGTAELMAPCVLWIDEVEKAISEGDNDGGTSRRLLGHLLTWMAERKAEVFMVTTANNIERLPAELVRKGRMDEIFFVDLPEPDVRSEIFSIHLKKRGLDVAAFDLEDLAASSEGFSGAEIEQAVVAARYLARDKAQPLITDHILVELGTTRPLSVVMSEKMARLRAWAEGRTVSAD